MLQKNKTIVFLTKGVAHITLVKAGRTPTITRTLRSTWSTDTLPALFSQIKQALQPVSLRILLADEYCYVLELVVPDTVPVSQERDFIASQLQLHIPDILQNNEWDFKITGTSKNGRKVLVFAPVRYIYQALVAAITQSGLPIEAVEPVHIASRRHANAILGLALKPDIQGNDREVLNVIPAEHSQHSGSHRHSKFGLWRWVLFALALLLIGSGILFWSKQPDQKNVSYAPSATPVQPTPSESLQPSPTPLPIDTETLKVQVLNGTGQRGASVAVRLLLESAGFSQITVGNAEQYGHDTTLIQKKSSVSTEIIPLLQDILTNYTIEESSPLTNEYPYDVLIIVGEINE